MPASPRVAAAPSTILAILAIGAIGAAIMPAPAATASAACPGAQSTAGALDETTLERSLLCLINERRGASGLRPVSKSRKLRTAAARHSRAMVSQGFFAHTSPSGRSFVDRIAATGYTRRSRSWLVGENLVWGSGDLSSPASLFAAWIDSPPHRANILRGRFREIGIAVVRGTPADRGDGTGVTVSSEYGFRASTKRGRSRGKKPASRRRLRQVGGIN
jgi:uncharacterized protein YkwD